MSALLIAALSVAALPADAPVMNAEPSVTTQSESARLMTEQLTSYFNAERVESMGFVGFGALALGTGIFFLTRNDPFLKGMAWPLMAVALIQIGVGGSVWWRTESQISQLISLMGSDAAKFVSDESARIAVVNRWFDVYKIAEIVIAVVGLGLVGGGYALGNRTVMGIGAGMALQGVVMLSLDLMAEARADRYTEQIAVFGKTLR